MVILEVAVEKNTVEIGQMAIGRITGLVGPVWVGRKALITAIGECPWVSGASTPKVVTYHFSCPN